MCVRARAKAHLFNEVNKKKLKQHEWHLHYGHWDSTNTSIMVALLLFGQMTTGEGKQVKFKKLIKTLKMKVFFISVCFLRWLLGSEVVNVYNEPRVIKNWGLHRQPGKYYNSNNKITLKTNRYATKLQQMIPYAELVKLRTFC